MIRLIAIDLDGTLYNDKKQISQRNKDAITKAKALGVKVVICTGRPLKAIQHILEELQLTDAGDYSITFNGGLAQKNDTGEILDKKTMTLKEVKIVRDFLADYDLPMSILSDHTVYDKDGANHPSLYQQANPFLDFEEASEENLTEDKVYNKIVSACEPDYLDAQIAKFPRSIQDHVGMVKSAVHLLEFLPLGVNKAYGLSKLAQRLGIKPEEVMAIGDEANDLPMLEYAGFGVAMDNAIEEVKKVCKYSTASNEEDGVAKIIEKLVLEEE